MTKQDFNAHKIIITRTMGMNMAIALKNGTSPFDYCYQEDNKVIEVRFNPTDSTPADTKEAVAGKMKFISEEIQAGKEVIIDGITYTPRCVAYVVGTSYTIRGRKLRERLADYQIKNKMKFFIISKIRASLNNEYKELDCKVMDLYKNGLINWNDVLVSHGKECSI